MGGFFGRNKQYCHDWLNILLNKGNLKLLGSDCDSMDNFVDHCNAVKKDGGMFIPSHCNDP